MVTIPEELRKMLKDQKFIVVGSVDPNGVANLSPRTAFYFADDVVYWLDFFKHKSQGNFQVIPWISVAVFDKEKLKGFQMKGKVTYLKDETTRKKITETISRSVTGKTSSKVFERISQNKRPDVLAFHPRVIYSLSPEEESGKPIGCDQDGETVAFFGRVKC
ncbi:MAG TPA: pyridoxamine 5'-phosphate oxidase family protein [Candidatus Nitrosotalea sp.]|nr:pyridoxamine 5'-phosphate oxidase family protein [Candidatus Nitrosotalea sp.]